MLFLGSLCFLMFVLLSINNAFASEEMDYELEQILLKLNEEDPYLRSEVADYLSYCGHPKAFELLTGILKDKDWAVRIAAVKALGEMGDRQSVQYIIQLLNDEYWHVKKEVIRVMGVLGGKDSVEALMFLLNVEDELIRSSAQKSLIKVGNMAIEGMLSKKPEDRWEASKTLGLLRDKRPLPLLVEALKIEKVEEVRKAIEEAIAIITSDTPMEIPPQPPMPPQVTVADSSPGVVSAQPQEEMLPAAPATAPLPDMPQLTESQVAEPSTPEMEEVFDFSAETALLQKGEQTRPLSQDGDKESQYEATSTHTAQDEELQKELDAFLASLDLEE